MRKLILASATMALLCSGVANANTDTGVRRMVATEAASQGVPVSFAMAIAKHESGFRCSAVGSHGERGVMQIKPSTARAMGYRGSARGLGDCRTGIYWGVKYLKAAVVAAAGDLKRAAFLYNAGLGAKTRNPAHKRYVAAVFKRKHSVD